MVVRTTWLLTEQFQLRSNANDSFHFLPKESKTTRQWYLYTKSFPRSIRVHMLVEGYSHGMAGAPHDTHLLKDSPTPFQSSECLLASLDQHTSASRKSNNGSSPSQHPRKRASGDWSSNPLSNDCCGHVTSRTNRVLALDKCCTSGISCIKVAVKALPISSFVPFPFSFPFLFTPLANKSKRGDA